MGPAEKQGPGTELGVQVGRFQKEREQEQRARDINKNMVEWEGAGPWVTGGGGKGEIREPAESHSGAERDKERVGVGSHDGHFGKPLRLVE